MKNSDKILGIFNEMMDGKRSSFATIPYTEDDKKEKDEKKEAGEDLMDFEGEKKSDEDKDSQDKADDVIKKVDLKEMDNQAKVELIGTIIETLQNSVESDDEFSKFMNKIVKIVDGYKFEKEGEEEKKEKKEEKEDKEDKEDKGEEKKEDKEDKKEGEKE